MAVRTFDMMLNEMATTKTAGKSEA